jgi:Uma2 family endonuclease
MAHVQVQAPLALGTDSEPEPDVAVISGSRRDYAEHPQAALLVIEVADSSLRFDRQVKGPLYARAGIPEYWIVNLVDRTLEVYRQPEQRDDAWDYRLVQSLRPEESVAPVTLPTQALQVADLLP